MSKRCRAVRADRGVVTERIDIGHIVDLLSTTDVHGERVADIFCVLVRELATGQPVAREQLAEILGWTRDEVVAALRQIQSMEFDSQGRIVGYGLTLRRTDHQMELAGRRLYTWCALDALMIPVMLGSVAKVQSLCAATGTAIRMTVCPEGVRDVDPDSAMVSLISPAANGEVRSAFCCRVQFFASSNIGMHWLGASSGVVMVGVREGFELGRTLARDLNERTRARAATRRLSAFR